MADEQQQQTIEALQREIQELRLQLEGRPAQPPAQRPAPAPQPRAPEVRPLPAFDGNRQDVHRWIAQAKVFAAAQHWSDDDTALILPTYLTGGAISVYLQIPERERTVNNIFNALREHFGVSGMVLRQQLYTRTQARDEGVLAYTAAIRDLAAVVEASQEEVKTVWTKGLAPRIRSHVLAVDNGTMTFGELVAIASRVETSFRDSAPMTSRREYEPRDQSKSSNRPEQRDVCYQCGKPGHIAKNCQDHQGGYRRDQDRQDQYRREHDRQDPTRREQDFGRRVNNNYAIRSPGHKDRQINMAKQGF